MTRDKCQAASGWEQLLMHGGTWGEGGGCSEVQQLYHWMNIPKDGQKSPDE